MRNNQRHLPSQPSPLHLRLRRGSFEANHTRKWCFSHSPITSLPPLFMGKWGARHIGYSEHLWIAIFIFWWSMVWNNCEIKEGYCIPKVNGIFTSKSSCSRALCKAESGTVGRANHCLLATPQISLSCKWKGLETKIFFMNSRTIIYV